jgi:hypothetical protein
MTRADGTEGSVSVRNAGRRCDWEVSYLSHKGEGKPLRDAASRGRRRSRTCGACAVHAGAVGTRTRIQLFRDDWRLHRAWRAFKRSGPATPAGAATACRCPLSARGWGWAPRTGQVGVVVSNRDVVGIGPCRASRFAPARERDERWPAYSLNRRCGS